MAKFIEIRDKNRMIGYEWMMVNLDWVDVITKGPDNNAIISLASPQVDGKCMLIETDDSYDSTVEILRDLVLEA